jgi:hypothetical protein
LCEQLLGLLARGALPYGAGVANADPTRLPTCAILHQPRAPDAVTQPAPPQPEAGKLIIEMNLVVLLWILAQ